MFFACQLLCSNGSHVICQCPFFNPFMHYVLHIDVRKFFFFVLRLIVCCRDQETESDLMIDNDLNGKMCTSEK